MKTVIVACGAGLATSSMVKQKIEDICKENSIKVKIIQCTLTEVEGFEAQGDLIVTTMKVRKKYNIPVISGSAYLSGVNEDAVTQQIVQALKS